MTEKQLAFHKRNAKNPRLGKCRVCGKPTEWLEERGKYRLTCGSQQCKDKEAQRYKENIMKKYGTTNLMADINYQKNKLMVNRKIAKVYQFKRPPFTKFNVLGNLEYKVLELIDKMKFVDPKGVYAPAPFTLTYKMDGEQQPKQHIPDIFLEDLNLIISVKDGLDNPNKHPSFKKDRLKSLCEYRHILINTEYNFLQVEGEADLKDLINVIKKIKSMKNNNSRFVSPPRVDFYMYHESPFTMEQDKDYLVLLHDKSKKVVIPFISKFKNSIVVYYYDHITKCIVTKNVFDIINANNDFEAVVVDVNSTERDFDSYISNPLMYGETYLRQVYTFFTGEYVDDELTFVENIFSFIENFDCVDLKTIVEENVDTKSLLNRIGGVN